MKLNNYGWSMKEMIFFSFILFVSLLVAIFYILRLHHGLESSSYGGNKVNEYSYAQVEENILNAGIKYYKEYYEEGSNVRITSDKLLKHGFLRTSELTPSNENKECFGYVVINEVEESSYITCHNYETIGYEE